MIQTIASDGAGEYITRLLEGAFNFIGITYTYSPMLRSIAPHAASSEDSITLKGENWGYWIQDYRETYVGEGRAPQGGNIDTGEIITHALCRTEDLNIATSPDEQESATDGAKVMAEDLEAAPIPENQLKCALGDFASGSYNVSVYLGNDKRGDTSKYIAGLVNTYDEDGYFDAHILTYDSRKVLHSLQYYPRIDTVTPNIGSMGGGTEVTITGGGFSMDEVSVVFHCQN